MLESRYLVASLHSEQETQQELSDWFRKVRHRVELAACIHGTNWWFRVDHSKCEDAIQILCMIPGAELFHLDESNRLIPVGCSVPVSTLPDDLKWQSLVAMSRLWLPASEESFDHAQSIAVVALKWEQAKAIREPNALLCRFDEWRYFVLRNVKQRWEHLQFARCKSASGIPLGAAAPNSQEHDTLLLGAPIPSVPGIRLKEQDRILLPVEMNWKPAVSTSTLHRAWSMTDTTWALWISEQHIDFLSNDDFCRASRASVNATSKQMVNG